MSKKTIQQLIRNLHRDIGFIVVGLTVIYVLSGILLIYRDSDFLKFEKVVEKTVSINLNEKDLGNALHIRNIEVIENKGDSIVFSNGVYCKSTGAVQYTEKTHPEFLNKMNSFHKSSNKDIKHWFSIIYAILLFFLAISSFWMFKSGTKKFYRGVILTALGLLIAMVFLYL